MDPAKLASILEGLGISGIDPTKLSEVMALIQSMGGVEVSEQGVKEYFPEAEESFYIPKAPKGFYVGKPLPSVPRPFKDVPSEGVDFYYNSKVGRKLVGL